MSQLNELEIKTALVIQKPAHEVFDAIVKASKMTNYFISKASADLIENTVVDWWFPEMDSSFPVKVGKIIPDKYISFNWDDPDGQSMLVEISLLQKPLGTFVTVTEKSKKNDDSGIRWLKSNTEGWANFLACLKAWIEYGINLRKGAFDPSQMPEVNPKN